jgi:putative hydrolase of the HAD superfamily
MTERLPKAILLDMDDTILADTVNAPRCWRVVCDRFTAEAPGLIPDRLLAEIERARDWYWSDPERHRRGRLSMARARQEVVSIALEALGVEQPDLARRIAQDFTALREAALRPFPGALETLRRLREKGVRLALLTNGSGADQRGKIERFCLAPLFDCIVIEGEFGAGKPDERVYRYACEQLGVTPAEAWMVGDHLDWEVAAPQRLGMFGVWVDNAGQGLPPSSPVRPDRIIRSLEELLELTDCLVTDQEDLSDLTSLHEAATEAARPHEEFLAESGRETHNLDAALAPALPAGNGADK